MTQQSSKGRECRTPVVHQFFVLKAQFYHFVLNIHAYVMGRVVDGVWGKFCADVEGFQGADLDDLRDMHDRYLDKIMTQVVLLTTTVVCGVEKCVIFVELPRCLLQHRRATRL